METDTPAERRLLTLWRLVRGYGSQVATALSAILLALASIKRFEGAQDAFTWVGGTLGVLGILGMVLMRPTYARLLDERNVALASARTRSQLLQRSLTTMLKRLARELDMTQTHHRLSVYCHRDEHFVMLARYSTHARWNMPGRVIYRESNDVISDAWNRGESVVVSLPQEKAKRVEKQCDVQGMTREDALGLTMPSRSLVGYRLTEADTHVGVLVLESTQPRGVNSRTLDALQGAAFASAVASLMSISRDHFPAMVEYVKPTAAPK